MNDKMAVEEWKRSANLKVNQEVEAFRRLHPTLIPEFLGWYVAISQGTVIDKDRNEFALAERVSGKFPKQFVLILEVENMVEAIEDQQNILELQLQEINA
jgi:hypothetical protein